MRRGLSINPIFTSLSWMSNILATAGNIWKGTTGEIRKGKYYGFIQMRQRV